MLIQERVTPFKKDLIFSVIIAAVVAAASLGIAALVPPLKENFEAVISDDGEVEIPHQRALQIAYTANYFNETESQFAPGGNSFYIQDYLNHINPTVTDKGLEYYRNPQTRGAVELFFIKVTGNRNITMAILTAANRENIPLTLAFALAHTESRFKPYARNVNVNGSIDRGLFQLNDRTFPQLSEEEFFDPSVSARYGMRHLRYCIGIAKDDLNGVAMYNAGVARIKANQMPASTKSYVKKIKNYRANLDAEFYKEVVSLYEDFGDTNSKFE